MAFLHLVRDNAEASLCGIPGAQLSATGILNDLVCDDCIDWLRKRGAAWVPLEKVEA